MQIECTQLVMDEEELRKKLKKDIFSFNAFVIGRRPISRIELKYVEYLVMEYDLIFKSNPIQKFIAPQAASSCYKLRVIGNGSTGDVSFLSKVPETEKKTVQEADVQYRVYEPNDMDRDVQNIAAKVSRKELGLRFPKARLSSIKSVYRPFWAVYYGAPKSDGRQLCCPYAADGFVIKQ